MILRFYEWQGEAPVSNTDEATLFWAGRKESSIVCVQLGPRKPVKGLEGAKGARHFSSFECWIGYLNGQRSASGLL